MSDSHDALLEEANRCAHRVARAASNRERAFKRWQSARPHNMAERQQAWAAACDFEDKALVAYEEIERRAQKEATG